MSTSSSAFSTTSAPPLTMSSTRSLPPSTTTTAISSVASETGTTRPGSPIATTSEAPSAISHDNHHRHLWLAHTFTTSIPSSLVTSYSGSSDVDCTALVAGVATAIVVSFPPPLSVLSSSINPPRNGASVSWRLSSKHFNRGGKGARPVGLVSHGLEDSTRQRYRHLPNVSLSRPCSITLLCPPSQPLHYSIASLPCGDSDRTLALRTQPFSIGHVPFTCCLALNTFLVCAVWLSGGRVGSNIAGNMFSDASDVITIIREPRDWKSARMSFQIFEEELSVY
ncbi:hypothetical protein EDD18DRAFT_1467111 [Armillaria luteobubalina]|uniref:Uncharacterized protein n=1 Tax=Armillaria luteobubalina TaxID=153913 RepID=A0AA39TFD6_9AGAR|nr:hypothetical protein EDD18DRAFT_1467111 [Armillaria luteobubalina]